MKKMKEHKRSSSCALSRSLSCHRTSASVLPCELHLFVWILENVRGSGAGSWRCCAHLDSFRLQPPHLANPKKTFINASCSRQSQKCPAKWNTCTSQKHHQQHKASLQQPTSLASFSPSPFASSRSLSGACSTAPGGLDPFDHSFSPCGASTHLPASPRLS